MSNTRPKHEFTVEKMNVKVFSDKQSVGTHSANFVVNHLQQVIADKETANLVVATGNSQHEFLLALRDIDTIDWKKVTVFHLDEYIALPADHPASFRRYLKKWLCCKE